MCRWPTGWGGVGSFFECLLAGQGSRLPLESLQDAAELSTELHISVHPHAAFCWLVADHAMLLLRCGLSFYR